MPGSSAPNSMNVLQWVLNPFVVGYLNPTNTSTFDAQPTNLTTKNHQINGTLRDNRDRELGNMKGNIDFFTLGRVVETGKEREEFEMGLEIRESDGSTGVANAWAIAD